MVELLVERLAASMVESTVARMAATAVETKDELKAVMKAAKMVVLMDDYWVVKSVEWKGRLKVGKLVVVKVVR